MTCKSKRSGKLTQTNKYKDFVALTTHAKVVDKLGQFIRASDVRMPRSNRDAGHLKDADF